MLSKAFLIEYSEPLLLLFLEFESQHESVVLFR